MLVFISLHKNIQNRRYKTKRKQIQAAQEAAAAAAAHQHQMTAAAAAAAAAASMAAAHYHHHHNASSPVFPQSQPPSSLLSTARSSTSPSNHHSSQQHSSSNKLPPVTRPITLLTHEGRPICSPGLVDRLFNHSSNATANNAARNLPLKLPAPTAPSSSNQFHEWLLHTRALQAVLQSSPMAVAAHNLLPSLLSSSKEILSDSKLSVSNDVGRNPDQGASIISDK